MARLSIFTLLAAASAAIATPVARQTKPDCNTSTSDLTLSGSSGPFKGKVTIYGSGCPGLTYTVALNSPDFSNEFCSWDSNNGKDLAITSEEAAYTYTCNTVQLSTFSAGDWVNVVYEGLDSEGFVWDTTKDATFSG